MTRSEEAVLFFKGGYSCAQAIMAAFAPSFGLDREMALKIASGFGGGMGRLAETCGVVTAAFMVLGLKCGSATTDKQGKETIYALVRDFGARFTAIHGSIVCRDLLGRDLNTPEGLASAQEKKLFSTVCPPYVETAAHILEDMLHD
jgi:C_GCAxxG_C_C family probable redox protein